MTGKAQKLGEILLESGLIDKLQLNTALKYQREWDRKLGEALVELGFISEAVLVKVLSKFLQVPSVELAQVRVNPLAIQKVPRRLAEKFGLMPVDLEGEAPRATLLVAMIDPTNLMAVDEVAFTSGCKIKPVVAAHSDIEKAIRRHYGDDRVVDVFFDGPAGSRPVAQNPFIKPVEGDDMVILQRGQEVTLKMSQPPEVSKPLPLAPVRLPANQSSGSMLDENWAHLPTDVLLRAVVQALIRKGVIDEQTLWREAQTAPDKKG